MAQQESTGSNFIWALAMIIIVALIAGALFYSGFLGNLGGPKQKNVDIKIDAPSTR
jgi:hypothetical protein